MKSEEKMVNMSLQEKVCQLTQVNAVYLHRNSQAQITGLEQDLKVTAQDLNMVGSVLNFSHGGEVLDIQREYLKNGDNHIPLIFMQDVIHGYRTLFPIPLAMGCTFDEQIVESCAEMSAKEAKANGVQLTFSPMVDLVRDPRWGRVAEGTGEDPYLNGEMGKAFIRGYHKGGLAACVKHFAGYGASESGKDYNITEISDHQLKEYYLRAYQECLKEKPEMVMSSFNLLNGIPVNGHRELLVDTLRKDWGFDGVLISDYAAVVEMIMHGYLEDEKACACVAANNEVDMEMMSTTYIRYLPELIREGKVSQETVDRMLRRVLTLKEKIGLLENPYIGIDYAAAKQMEYGLAHREIARKAVEKSCVLLKNNHTLPLKKEQKVALIGPFADEKNLYGCWKCCDESERTVTMREAFEKILGRSVICEKGCGNALLETDTTGIADAVAAAGNADVIVVCIGEPSGYCGESQSRADLRIPKVQRKLVGALSKLNKPVVGVVFGGRPQVLTQIEPMLDSILYVWQPGTEGGNGIANLLYGKAVPSAKTTMSFPRSTGQCPIYYNHFNTGRPKDPDTFDNRNYCSSYVDELNQPLYPFGYGLSYTTFSLSDMRLSADVLRQGSAITASIVVSNTGAYDGEEVVQLYLRDYHASMVRPVQELKDYKKIFLKAGESMRLKFEITEETLRFYDANGKYTAEDGRFALMLGNSSVNVLQKDFEYRISE